MDTMRALQDKRRVDEEHEMGAIFNMARIDPRGAANAWNRSYFGMKYGPITYAGAKGDWVGYKDGSGKLYALNRTTGKFSEGVGAGKPVAGKGAKFPSWNEIEATVDKQAAGIVYNLGLGKEDDGSIPMEQKATIDLLMADPDLRKAYDPDTGKVRIPFLKNLLMQKILDGQSVELGGYNDADTAEPVEPESKPVPGRVKVLIMAGPEKGKHYEIDDKDFDPSWMKKI